MTIRFSLACVLFTPFVMAMACSSSPEATGDQDGSGSGTGGKGSGASSGTGSSSGAGAASSGNGGSIIGLAGSGNGAQSGTGGGGPVCETAQSEAQLQPIFLAFALDVSGSMGQIDCPHWYHDPVAKWTPVVEATTAFFEDTDSAGISASLTLFPSKGDSTAKCSAASYEEPEVPMTALPSNDFQTVVDAYDVEVGLADYTMPMPKGGGSWRGGTPTLAVFNGVSTSLSSVMGSNPEAKFAVVLVTDGLPQGCGGDSDMEVVAAAVQTVHEAGLPTYVIGVNQPETPPAEAPWAEGWACDGDMDAEPNTPNANLENLNDIAEAGGTESAFLIDTGNPEATKNAFREAVDAIRSQAISCELGIPEHPTPGETFDKDKINVSMAAGDDTTDLAYDPECGEDGGWRYDDADEPTWIELCPDTCQTVRAMPGAELNVDFLCEVRPDVLK